MFGREERIKREQRRLDSYRHHHPPITCGQNGSKNFRGIFHFILPDTVCGAHSGRDSDHIRPADVCPRSEDEQRARPSCPCRVGDGEPGFAHYIAFL